MFPALPDKPDHDALERGILQLWERQGTFSQVRAKNAGGPRFSFTDGPVTANKTLGVHTAWGRTLKDVFQRYKAMRGFDQRYQNGFDCQGLWIEVGVERQLGLSSKRDIEAYGLEAFARKCREVVVESSAALTSGSIRLGQWMDWERSYYTFSDTNIEYIWRFLRIVHERGWLFRGHRVTEWCPRCGTSISAHELSGSYTDREDPSLSVRFPLLDRPGEAIVVWTTTPWTLPANVAAAVHPDARYGRRGGDWTAVDRADGPAGTDGPAGLADTDGPADANRADEFDEVLLGRDLAGWRYQGPFDSFEAAAGIEHRVILWDEVSLEEGTGVVHIAPGCGVEDFALGKEHDLPVISPVDESGVFLPAFGWLAGRRTADVADEVIDDLRRRSLLVRAATIHHRYPECWRCHTPLIFRVSDDWFISVDEIRGPMREANRTVTWVPEYMGKRMDDWLVNMSDWNISRRRYYGLPLPFYPCACGHLNVIGSRDELARRAIGPSDRESGGGGPLDGLEELRRPWIDDVEIRCEDCGEAVRRIPEVGDVWLDAGIVPFSTLGWQNPELIEEGYATGAARGLTRADLPDHAYWEQWFPADWVSEMREQIRLWFYSQLFMSVTLTGQAPYRTVLGYEKMLDEHGVEMHGSTGNMISADEAFTRMGADVMRWQYSMQPPNRNLLFGFTPGQEIQRRLLTLWNSVRFFVQYANMAGFTPRYADLASGPPLGERSDSAATLDEWIVARTGQLVAEAEEAYEGLLSVNVLRAYESFLDDLSNWYIRRSRRLFWNGDETALRTLWYALVQSLRTISPVVPFLTERLWQDLVVATCPDAPPSIFLAGWPERAELDTGLLQAVTAVRRVVELGRQARSNRQLRLRQPLARAIVEGTVDLEAYRDQIADELRVKEVLFGAVGATELRVRPNLPVLGPRLGADVGRVRQALAAGQFEELDGDRFRVAGHTLGPGDVLVERTARPGWEIAAEDGVVVALDTALDDELRREARVYDTIHLVNRLRRDAGLEITDRIRLSLPGADADLLDYRDWIAAETLAKSIDADAGAEVAFSRV
jgi:isoleucyl-tRNA synthetase